MSKDITLDEAAKGSSENKPTGAKRKYRCVQKCYFENVLYNEGDIIVVSEDKKMPEHFSKVLF